MEKKIEFENGELEILLPELDAPQGILRSKLRDISKGDATSPDNYFARVKGAITGTEKGGNVKFILNTGLEYEVINGNNPHKVRVPKENGEWNNFLPAYPWSIGQGVSAAVIYRLFAEVEGDYRSGEFPVAVGAEASIGLNSGSRMEVSYIVSHENETTLADCIKKDLVDTSFLYSRSAANAKKLRPNKEFLLTRYQGAVAFEANVTWGQILRSDPGLLRTIIPRGAARYLSSSADEEVVELGLGAEAGLGVQVNTGLELVASTEKDSNTDKIFSKLTLRKSSRNSTTGNLEFTITANIPDTKSSLKALVQFLTLRVPNIGKSVDEIEAILSDVRERVAQLRDAPNLAEIYFSEWVGEKLEGVLEIAETWKDKLNASVNDWIGLHYHLEKIEEAIEDVAKYLDIESKVDGIIENLLLRARSFEESKLSPEARKLLTTILQHPSFEGHTGLSLVAFLSLNHFRQKLKLLIVGTGDDALDTLRAQLLKAVDLTGVSSMLKEKELDLFALIEKGSGYSIASLLAYLQSKLTLKSLVPPAAMVTVDEILEKVASSLEVILDQADEVVNWVGGTVNYLPERIDEILTRLATAIPREIEAAARFEFERIQENETLLSFSYDLSNDGFSGVYTNLIRGNWQKTLDAYDPNSPSPFRELRFYAIEKVTKRKSFYLRLFKSEFSQEAIDTLYQVDNIMGYSKYDFISEGRWHVYRNNPLKNKVTRDWKGFSLLKAEGTEFIKDDDARGSAFRFSYQAGISLSGPVDPDADPWTTKRENWELFKCISMIFDGKTSSPQSVYNTASSIIKNDEKEIQLELSFQVRSEQVLKLWDIVPLPKNGMSFDQGDAQMVDYYLEIWPALKKARQQDKPETSKGLTYSEEANFNQYFESIARLKERVAGTGSSMSLFRAMKDWRFHTNRAASADDKLDKIGYPLSILAHMPKDQIGWTVSAVLTIDDRKYFFG